MTSLILDRRDRTTEPRPRSRPLVLVSTLGGVVAALAPLLVCLAVGVVGWFAADAGAHGAPHDGMRVGALAWLMAHGSGLTVQGAGVTLVPLGLTAICGWAHWRVGHRVGALVSGHGPDADRISDGERDLTVPIAVGTFFAGYAVAAVVVATFAAGPDTTPSVVRVLAWSALLTATCAAPAIAIGSGRAPIWAERVPLTARHAMLTALRILRAFVLVSLAVLLVSLALGIADAATMMGRLHLDAGEGLVYGLVNLAFAPNAGAYTGSFLLGPGFAVGTGTVVSPALVVLGPLPLLPLLAALPGAATPAAGLGSVVVVPAVVAAVAAARWQHRQPTLNWFEAALRGCGGGLLAAFGYAAMAALSGGSAGPGRMSTVGPDAGEVLVHALVAFGFGGLVGALAMTWWQRRLVATDDV